MNPNPLQDKVSFISPVSMDLGNPLYRNLSMWDNIILYIIIFEICLKGNFIMEDSGIITNKSLVSDHTIISAESPE